MGSAIIFFAIDFLITRNIIESKNNAISSNLSMEKPPLNILMQKGNKEESEKEKDKDKEKLLKANKSEIPTVSAERLLQNFKIKTKQGIATEVEINNDSDVTEDYRTTKKDNTIQLYENEGVNSETILLCSQTISKPLLITYEENKKMSIPIVKNRFVLGRLDGQVDHLIKSDLVGRIHAEITIKYGKHFLNDLNSRNGTFLNGQKLQSNKDYELSSKDKLIFGDKQYEFIILRI